MEQTEYNGTNVTSDHLQFLDDLRESGVTNMFGASPYVEDMFEVSRRDSKNILVYWMNTFSDRHG